MFHVRSTLAALAAFALLIAGCGGHVHSSRVQSTHQQSARTARATTVAPSQSATGSVAPLGWGTTPPGFSAPHITAQSVATGEMLDGIFVSEFHGLTPFAVAGYTAGHWPDYLGLHAAFPAAHSVSIAIAARYHADCLDDEPGDATPAQAGPWVLADIKAGFSKPCVYGDLSEMPAIKASLAAALGANWRSRVFLWLAWYRFRSGLVPGYDAVQWTDKALGRNLDESTVSLAFLSIAQPPFLPPKPAPNPKPKPAAVRWSSAEIQITSLTGACTATAKHGHWTASKGCRVHSLPFNAKPLGG